MKSESFILSLIIRLLTLPFYMGMLTVGHTVIYIRMVIGYLRWGGELITYKKLKNRRTIEDVFDKLKEIQDNEKHPQM